MWMNLDQKYLFGMNWLIFEVLGFLLVIFIAVESFTDHKLIKKHLLPLALGVAIFFSSNSLRLFALTVTLRLVLNLEMH